ncbi:GH32 C-terminal domain-containing protein [Sporolactobacillus sp. STSJ-5]|nr:GH32 C-terminal domain-containing protein [Sporolactobacillus sp. STSJ-5]MCQ2010423.1 GH32 C-terminal domain-containing protein [Sporolactobacillus sp. STSJ-5]
MNRLLKFSIALLIGIGLMVPSLPVQVKAEDSSSHYYQEPYRNQYHYSAQQNWLNDPNGLIKYNGVYHMFYQYNPEGNEWGNMSWGHAISKDLVHWKEQKVAIPEDDNDAWVDFWMQTKDDAKPVHYLGRPTTNWDLNNPNGKRYIFSGSVVLDKDNVSGFGQNTLIAFYTSTYQVCVRDDDYSKDSLGNIIGIREVQEQNMAYSTDGGKTFKKYNNQKPIIPVTEVRTKDAGNFRDPNVVYDEANQEWIMPVVSGQEVEIFASKNLKDWDYQTSIKRENDVGNGVWECPELIPMTVKGTNEKKWVLSLSVQNGAPAGGSGMQYFVGTLGKNDADKIAFTPDTDDTMKNPQWFDYGEDFYAGITFANVPDRTIMLGWMSNWTYNGEQNTSPWKGEMTLPRELNLEKSDSGYTIRQEPVSEIDDQIGQGAINLGDEKIKDSYGDTETSQIKDFSGTQYKISADFTWTNASEPNDLGYLLRQSDDGSKYVKVGYDPQKQIVYLDRTKDGESINRQETKVKLDKKASSIKLTVYVDTSSIEVFVNDGEKVITQLVYPNPDQPSDSRNLAYFVNNGTVSISQAEGEHLKSIWGNNPSIKAPNETTLNYGDSFDALNGVSANDLKDGDLTSDIKVSGDTVKTKTPGTYQITYSVANQAGVTATKTIKVNIVMDGQAAADDAVQLVETAEQSQLQKDADAAKLFVAQLPEGTTKDSLNARLKVVQEKIDGAAAAEEAAKAVEAATKAVEQAEQTKSQADVDAAKVKVNALAEGTTKDSLNARLKVVQEKIDGAAAEEETAKAVEAATKAVEQAEQTKSQADVDAARVKVNALADSDAKSALEKRLDALQKTSDTENAKEHTYYVKKGSYLYSSSNGSKTRIGFIAVNTKVKTKTDPSAKMYKITYKGKTGYVYRVNLGEKPLSVTRYVHKSSYLYSTNTSKKRKGIKIATNVKLQTISTLSSKMYKVTYKGKTGYVYKVNLGTKAQSVTRYVHKPSYLYSTNTGKKRKGIKIPKNTKLKTKSPLSAKMYKVTYKGKTGYVYRVNLGTKPLKKR